MWHEYYSTIILFIESTKKNKVELYSPYTTLVKISWHPIRTPRVMNQNLIDLQYVDTNNTSVSCNHP